MSGLVLGVAIGEDRICAARSDRSDAVQSWPIDDQLAETPVPLGERVVTAIGVMQVRGLRESVQIGKIMIACTAEQTSQLKDDIHLFGIGEISYQDYSGAQWAGTKSVTNFSGSGEVALIDIIGPKALARIVDTSTNALRTIGEQPLAGDRPSAVLTAVSQLLAQVAAGGRTLSAVYVSGTNEDTAGLTEFKAIRGFEIIDESTAVAARGAAGGNGTAAAASGGSSGAPRHSARHAAPTKKSFWSR